MAQNDASEFDTGIDFQTRRDDDVEAWIDDGEHAVTYHITELEDDGHHALEIVKMYHEAGLTDKISTRVIDTDKRPAEFARENLLRAKAAREEFECALDYWE